METKSLYQFLFFNEQQVLFGETTLSLGLVANQLILKSHWRFFEYPLCGRTIPGSGTITVNKTQLIPAFCVLTVPSTLTHCGHRAHRAVSCFSFTILQYNDLLDMSLSHFVSSTIQKKSLLLWQVMNKVCEHSLAEPYVEWSAYFCKPYFKRSKDKREHIHKEATWTLKPSYMRRWGQLI